MQRKKVDLVFLVLTYRNTQDLINFIESTKRQVKETYKIIVVNSFYDNDSNNVFYQIARENDCDFIQVANKGYGFGNNRGIEYALANYEFRFLIVSNPDIEIEKFSMEELEGLENCILAPTIKTLTGKDQNPYYYSKIELVEWLKYYSYVKNIRLIAFIGIIINKVYREVSLFVDRALGIRKRKIYAVHGSFVIFGREALLRLGKIYDEEMFLLHEENHLARLALKKNIKTYMIHSIKVLHKEDGSISLENENIARIGRESYITYYEKWKKKGCADFGDSN
ncbi:Glycosyltransferase, GT2 family [Anoxybacillus pushchinoensis]|uniref:Glycosyltransferase, GT2 family n=1 Tax=Anoxybacillus pushchinoensis TaxID=150248 RepID=A0A1I0U901_9BACL|nr:glycosyltransferase family 2 protein [Anoxybacillus pushchinoensis]SFA60400.1 Glycosyltransferase, GT2 family [Anoxybacillus pushchinoensis]